MVCHHGIGLQMCSSNPRLLIVPPATFCTEATYSKVQLLSIDGRSQKEGEVVYNFELMLHSCSIFLMVDLVGKLYLETHRVTVNPVLADMVHSGITNKQIPVVK